MEESIWRPYALRLDHRIQQTQASLRRIPHLTRQQNRSRAGSEDWPS